MAIGETTNIEQTSFQNNADVTSSYSMASSWLGRGVSELPLALVGLVALGVLAQGANAYGYNSWTETECGFNFWGDYECWMKQCHLEEVCTHLFGFAMCHQEKVCTHY